MPGSPTIISTPQRELAKGHETCAGMPWHALYIGVERPRVRPASQGDHDTSLVQAQAASTSDVHPVSANASAVEMNADLPTSDPANVNFPRRAAK